MKIYVTGISGYVGLAVAAHLVRSGHTVCGLVRNEATAARVRAAVPEATLDVGDLARPGDWCERIRLSDAVVHLAARKNGNLHEQLAGTVATTETVLGALGQDWRGRFVLASSFTVYDFRRLRRGQVLQEDSPVYDDPYEAGPYTQSKTLQERLVREFATSGVASVVTLRIAGVYGRGPAWSAGVAIRLSDSIGIMFAPRSATKLVHVDNVATAVECAVRIDVAPGGPINVIDDIRPTFRSLSKGLRAAGVPVPRTIPVPFAVLEIGERILSRIAPEGWPYSTRLEILTATGVRESWLPLRYSNERAKRELGWQPRNLMRQAYQEAADAREG